MNSSTTTIDLAALPSPQVVENISVEAILAEMLTDLRSRAPEFTTFSEADPAFKILEVAAYREMLIRNRVNLAAKAVMLAFATGSDLDQIGANFGVKRLVITEGNESSVPPTESIYESDTDFRARIQLSPEGFTTAGSAASYVFHGIGSDADVKDIHAVSHTPGTVSVYVLSRTGTGSAPPALLEKVSKALNAERVRPITDKVTVLSADIVEYTIKAEIVLYPGPDSTVVLAQAQSALEKYTSAQRRIGYDIPLSGIYAALHQPGVQRVILTSPASDIAIGEGQSSHCISTTVNVAESTGV